MELEVIIRSNNTILIEKYECEIKALTDKNYELKMRITEYYNT